MLEVRHRPRNVSYLPCQLVAVKDESFAKLSLNGFRFPDGFDETALLNARSNDDLTKSSAGNYHQGLMKVAYIILVDRLVRPGFDSM